MATVLITGGTGLIGSAITEVLLHKGYEVIILTRHLPVRAATKNPVYAEWDIRKEKIDKEAVCRADFIIHLAGAGIGEKRWTPERQKEIADSRVKSATLLVKTLHENTNRVKAVISASGSDWYGADPAVPNPDPYTEDAPADGSFLGDTCLQWENSIRPVTAAGKRLVILRTGVVLSAHGGALKNFKKALTFGIAPVFGHGKQVLSWIHIDDLVNLYIAALEDGTMSGVYNAVAPVPVNNKTFITTLARINNRFFIPVHVPAFILKFILGKMSIAVLKSCTVSCRKIQQKGFVFRFPDITHALQNILR